MRELAFLNKALKITLTDEREDPPKSQEFRFDGGIAEFIKHLNRGKNVLHDKPIYFEGERDLPNGKLSMEVAHAVQRQLFGLGVQLRQQHQHRRWRHAI